MLIISSIALVFSVALRGHHRLPADARRSSLVHGVFWSGLLSASAAYMTSMLPERRRAEGHRLLGAVDMAAIAWRRRSASGSIAAAGCGCACSRGVLNLRDGGIAMSLPEQPHGAPHEPRRAGAGCSSGACWSSRSRCSSIRSATAASPASPRCTPTRTASTPKGIYLTALAIVDAAARGRSPAASAIAWATSACSFRAWC